MTPEPDIRTAGQRPSADRAGGFPARAAGDRNRLRLRTRLGILAALLAILPAALGAWALGNELQRNERREADAALNTTLRAVLGAFAERVDDARARAEALAASSDVQRALEKRDRRTLRRLARANPNTTFVAGATRLAGPPPAAGVQNAVEVNVNSRLVGQVSVVVPLDDRFAGDLRRAANVPSGVSLALTDSRRVVAGDLPRGTALDLPVTMATDLRLGSTEFRGVAARPVGTPGGSQAIVLKRRAAYEAAAESARSWAWAGGVAAVLALGALAFALAPAIVRNRALQQQRSQAARVLAYVGDAVVLVDADGIVRFWNAAAEAISERTAESVLGQPIRQVIADWPLVERLVPASSEPGEPGSEGIRTLPVGLGGQERWLSVSGVRFAEGTVYTFRDLTGERRLEELKSDFIATVSHELRTPLAAIAGAAHTLRGRAELLTPELRDQLLAVITESTARLTRIADDLLVAGQLMYGRLPIVDERFDAAAVAQSVVAEQRRSPPPGLSVELDAQEGLAPVAGDSEKARQVLSNLVENAIKNSPGGGVVEVRVEPRDGQMRFSVSDQGLGIPASEQERVFDKFYRLDPQLTRGVSGTGLGLYICRELVERMDGRLWVESAPGEGSTFTFELPLAEAPAAPEPAAPAAVESAR